MGKTLWWRNWRPAGFKWSKRLSVGNAILDSEHRNLVGKINDIMRMVEAEDVAALPDAFERLEAWLLIHFDNEKMFARAIDLDFDHHELVHLRFLNELQCLKDDLAAKNWWANPGSKAESCYRLLHGWLIEHIVEYDMAMKPALQNYRYDYIPSTIKTVAVDS